MQDSRNLNHPSCVAMCFPDERQLQYAFTEFYMSYVLW